MEKLLFNNFVKSDKFKNEFKEITKPLFQYFLDEIGIYLYFFIFFILTSFILHLGIFILLIRYILRENNNNYNT